jgi:hypothetical protein
VSRLRQLAVIVLAIGVTCQFIQRTDPRFAPVYYTVDSAILATAVLLALQSPWTAMAARIHNAAVAGVVFSALIYATVIAPTSSSGEWFAPHDDPWARAATVLLHGIAPLLVVADYLGAPSPSASTLKAAISSLWWPIAYLTVISLLAWGGVIQMPYRFLSPSASGPALVACAIAGLAAISAGLAAALEKTSSLLTARTGGSRTGAVSAVRRPPLER